MKKTNVMLLNKPSIDAVKMALFVALSLSLGWIVACEDTAFSSSTVSNEKHSNIETIEDKKMNQIGSMNVHERTNSSDQLVVILPGYGTGKAHIGMSREAILESLGPPGEEYSHDGYCKYVEMHWSPKANADGSMADGNGVFAYLDDEGVFSLSFSGDEYETQFGVGNWTPANVAKEKLGWPLFLLTPSANTATYHEDLMYLIGSDEGMAFELGVGYKTKERFVYAIYVFRRGSKFLPWGCISKNQTLVQISDSGIVL